MRLLNFSSTLKFRTVVTSTVCHHQRWIISYTKKELQGLIQKTIVATSTFSGVACLHHHVQKNLTLPIMAFSEHTPLEREVCFPRQLLLLSGQLRADVTEHSNTAPSQTPLMRTTSSFSNVSSELWVFPGHQYIF